jgi:hypothetical protein
VSDSSVLNVTDEDSIVTVSSITNKSKERSLIELAALDVEPIIYNPKNQELINRSLQTSFEDVVEIKLSKSTVPVKFNNLVSFIRNLIIDKSKPILGKNELYIKTQLLQFVNSSSAPPSGSASGSGRPDVRRAIQVSGVDYGGYRVPRTPGKLKTGRTSLTGLIKSPALKRSLTISHNLK